MKNLYIYIKCDDFFVEKVKYVFLTFCNLFGINSIFLNDYKKIKEKFPIIVYSFTDLEIEQKHIFIKSTGTDRTIFEKQELDIKDIKIRRWQNSYLPILFSGNDDKLYEKKNNKFHIFDDIILSAFYLLSGWQEYVNDKRDEHKRFPFSESLQKKLDIIYRPVVNDYFEILRYSLKEIFDLDLDINLWNGKPFGSLITVDVDFLNKYTIRGIGKHLFLFLKRKIPFSTAFSYLWHFLFKKDPYFNFDELGNLFNKYSVKGVFYFLLNGKSKFDTKHCLKHNKIKKVVRRLRKNQQNVALHPSYNAFVNNELFSKEKNIFENLTGNAVLGVRQHFLRFDAVKTLRILRQNGIKYDTTLGFAESEGFRNSFCFPFRLYDLKNDTMSDVWEFPLIIMDTTILVYNKLGHNELFDKIKKFVDIIKQYNGLIVILVHNSNFDVEKYPDAYEILENILNYLRATNTLFINDLELIKLLNNEM